DQVGCDPRVPRAVPAPLAPPNRAAETPLLNPAARSVGSHGLALPTHGIPGGEWRSGLFGGPMHPSPTPELPMRLCWLLLPSVFLGACAHQQAAQTAPAQPIVAQPAAPSPTPAPRPRPTTPPS